MATTQTPNLQTIHLWWKQLRPKTQWAKNAAIVSKMCKQTTVLSIVQLHTATITIPCLKLTQTSIDGTAYTF
jgi:hypothetical protein